jgi:hypothetical protein
MAVVKMNDTEISGEKTSEDNTSESERAKIETILRKYYFNKKDQYFDEVSEDIGIWQSGCHVANDPNDAEPGYWENEEEIEDGALSLYIEKLYHVNDDLINCIINDYVEDEDDSFKIYDYLLKSSYEDLYKIFYN